MTFKVGIDDIVCPIRTYTSRTSCSCLCNTTGFFKKNNHPHIHGQRELFAPPCPRLNVGHSGCTRRPSKKTTILVTGASHYNLLQHWVGGAGGAAIALLDVDVVVFFEEPGMSDRLQLDMKIDSHLIPSACHIVDVQFLVLVEFHESCVTISRVHSFSLLSPRQCPAIFVEFQQKFEANEPYVGWDQEFDELLWILQVIIWRNRRNRSKVIAEGWLHHCESMVDLGTFSDKLTLAWYHISKSSNSPKSQK